jgi:hypothetical protein
MATNDNDFKPKTSAPIIECPMLFGDHFVKLVNADYAMRWVFTMGCGCALTDKESVTKHCWKDCESPASEFWVDRFQLEGRTTSHPTNETEIYEIFCRCDVDTTALPRLKEILTESNETLAPKNGIKYCDIMRRHRANIPECMTLLEESEMAAELRGWFLENDVKPPELYPIHLATTVKLMAEETERALTSSPEVADVTLYSHWIATN